jgi:type I restriction enzyme S subunit
MSKSLSTEFSFLPKTGRAASFASVDGAFPFFTSSQDTVRRAPEADCYGPALVFGTGGSASIHVVDGPFSASNDCYVCKPDSGRMDDAKFVYYFLKSNIHLIEEGFKGAGLKHVSKKHLMDLRIPVSEGIDRRHVVTILDKADGIRRKRDQALTLVDDFLRSVFLEMFGDLNSKKHNFPVTSVEGICEIITDCLHTTPSHFDEPNPYPSIRSSELQGGYIDLSSAKYVSEAEYKVRIQRYRPVPGDTIYCREGARFGNCGIVPEGMTPCLGQRTMLLRADRKVATPEYLWAVLRSQSIFQQALNVVGGAASPHVNIKDIRKFKCFMPPLTVQRQFSVICECGFSQRNWLIKQGVEAENLFAALCQRAFSGDL